MQLELLTKRKQISSVRSKVSLAVKAKVPRNRPEGPEMVRVIALLSLDLSARRGWVVSTRPWVGPTAGLNVCEKSRPHQDSISGPSSP
jgi:hypothetical protein